MFKQKSPKATHSSHPVPEGGEPIIDIEHELHDAQQPVSDTLEERTTSFEVLRPASRGSSREMTEDEENDMMDDSPLGQAFGYLLKELARLKVKGKAKTHILETEPICRLLNEHLQISEQQEEKQHDLEGRLAKLELEARVTPEEKHLEQLYKNPLYAAQVEPPAHFGLGMDKAALDRKFKVEKLLPRGNQRFSGTENSVPVHEFLTRMNDVQTLAEFSEEEFKKRLLISCTGEPYRMCQLYIESGASIAKIYHSFESLFDHTEPPAHSIEKLRRFKIDRNMSSKQAEVEISKLALNACRTYPKGETRNLQFHALATTSYYDALPTKATEFVRQRTNDLSIKLGRAPEFNEITTELDPHRYLLDQFIAMQARPPFGPRPTGPTIYPKNQFSSRYPASPYRQVNSITGSLREAGGRLGRLAGQQRGVRGQVGGRGRGAGRRGGQAGPARRGNYAGRVNYVQTDNTGQRGRSFSSRGSANGRSLYCSLCGGTNHTAAMGCYKMRDDKGEHVPNVQPAFGECTQCNFKLHHPEKYCWVARARRQGHSRESRGKNKTSA